MGSTWFEKLKFKVFRDYFSRIIYVDTDAYLFLLELPHHINVNDVFRGHHDIFDFSNLSKDNPLYSTVNANKGGLLKSEVVGHIQSVIALAPKCYTVLAFGHNGGPAEQVKIACKGVAHYRREKMTYETFRKVLYEGGVEKVKFNCIRSVDYVLYIMETTKTGLSALQVKSYLLGEHGIESVPFGYYRLGPGKNESKNVLPWMIDGTADRTDIVL